MHSIAKVISLAMLVAVTGCTSMRITPNSEALVVPDTTRGDELRQLVLILDDTTDGKDAISLNAFAEALRKAAIFKSVVLARNGESADLHLSKFRHELPPPWQGFQCFEPLLLMMSVGIVPAICEGDHVLSFALTRTGGNEQMTVKEGFAQKTLTGWAAVPLNAFSKWKKDGAYENFLALVFLSRKEAILEMVGTNPSQQRTGASGRP